MTAFAIAGRDIGPGAPAYIIAEMSANHLGDFDRAQRIVRKAAEAGADAVKLQTYTPDTMTLPVDSPLFRVGEGSPWAGRKLHDLYAEAMTPWEWHAALKELAESLGMALFSSPFDATAVDFLERLAVPAYKIASFELVDIPLVKRIAETGKPVILSTGMADEDEIAEAVDTLRDAGARAVALLHCISDYPAAPGAMRLRAIPWLATRFHAVSGLSDHSPGAHIACAAVALGARIIEKHLTLARADGGPDAGFSLEPAEFAALVREIREIESALAEAPQPKEGGEGAHRALRRSLFAAADIPREARLDETNIRCVRPGNGLHPRHYPELLGRRARIPIPAGTPLTWDLLE